MRKWVHLSQRKDGDSKRMVSICGTLYTQEQAAEIGMELLVLLLEIGKAAQRGEVL